MNQLYKFPENDIITLIFFLPNGTVLYIQFWILNFK